MPRSIFRLVVGLALIAGIGLAGVALEDKLALYFKPPWMSQCDRLKVRCEAQEDLAGAMVCGAANLANLIKKSEAACEQANAALD